jgi:endonuclease YncB( thermonuclease family)
MSRTSAARWPRRRYPPRPPSRLRRFLDYALAAAILGLLILVTARIDRVATRHVAGDAVVNDGDTITLKGQRIRLRGIDAPEYHQTCEKDGATYACGRAAREALVKLAGGGAIDCTGWERDRYDRLLAVCKAGGVDLNRRQVEDGWAVAYGDYADAEQSAHDRHVGLWVGSFERPREWRVEHGGMAEGEHDLFAGIVSWLAQIFGFS